MMRWLRLGLPLVLLIVLAGLLARGLQFDPKNLPSATVGKPAPVMSLPVLGGASSLQFKSESMRGKVWLLNVFASWCTACVSEHPRLIEFAASYGVPLIGLAYKDKPGDTDAWLSRFGNPYQLVALDLDGRIGIDFGVYGVPETYVIDADGVIRYRQVGPIEGDFFAQHVAPLLNGASGASSGKGGR